MNRRVGEPSGTIPVKITIRVPAALYRDISARTRGDVGPLLAHWVTRALAGKATHGQRPERWKLSPEQITEARRLRHLHHSFASIGDRLGVSGETVRLTLRRVA